MPYNDNLSNVQMDCFSGSRWQRFFCKTTAIITDLYQLQLTGVSLRIYVACFLSQRYYLYPSLSVTYQKLRLPFLENPPQIF